MGSKDNQHEFSPHLVEVLRKPPSPMPRVVLLSLVLLVGILITWSFIGRLDIVVRADGKLLPKSRVNIVQPMEGGRVAKILVSEGDEVEKGQPLMLMDTSLSSADTESLQKDLRHLKLQLRRIAFELNETKALSQLDEDRPAEFLRVVKQGENNRSAFQAVLREREATLTKLRQQLATAKETQTKLSETLPLIQSQEKAYADLKRSGGISQVEAMEFERKRIEAERDYKAQKHNVKALLAELDEIKASMDRLKLEYQKNLTDERVDTAQRIATLEQELKKQEYRNQSLELKATQSGIVKDLATHTEGYVVPAGTTLLTIVPKGEPLIAEVFVADKDIGFVAEQQAAKVKVSAYEFQRYGMIEASVKRVSPDASTTSDRNGNVVPAGYKAELELSAQQLTKGSKTFELRPGMAISAEIAIGERSVMSYLLSPVLKTIDEAGTER